MPRTAHMQYLQGKAIFRNGYVKDIYFYCYVPQQIYDWDQIFSTQQGRNIEESVSDFLRSNSGGDQVSRKGGNQCVKKKCFATISGSFIIANEV